MLTVFNESFCKPITASGAVEPPVATLATGRACEFERAEGEVSGTMVGTEVDVVSAGAGIVGAAARPNLDCQIWCKLCTGAPGGAAPEALPPTAIAPGRKASGPTTAGPTVAETGGMEAVDARGSAASPTLGCLRIIATDGGVTVDGSGAAGPGEGVANASDETGSAAGFAIVNRGSDASLLKNSIACTDSGSAPGVFGGKADAGAVDCRRAGGANGLGKSVGASNGGIHWEAPARMWKACDGSNEVERHLAVSTTEIGRGPRSSRSPDPGAKCPPAVAPGAHRSDTVAPVAFPTAAAASTASLRGVKCRRSADRLLSSSFAERVFRSPNQRSRPPIIERTGGSLVALKRPSG